MLKETDGAGSDFDYYEMIGARCQHMIHILYGFI